MKIYQIILGEIPEYLEACVNSIIVFAEKHKFELIQIKTIDEKYQSVPHWENSKNSEYFRNRLIKDWISLDILSTEARSLLIDWDIYAHAKKNPFSPSFGALPMLAAFPFDCMMYNGDNLGAFRQILEGAGPLPDSKPGQLPVHIGFAKHNNFKYLQFDNRTYTHVANSLLVQ